MGREIDLGADGLGERDGFEGGMWVGVGDGFGQGNRFGDGHGLGKQMGLEAGDGFGRETGWGGIWIWGQMGLGRETRLVGKTSGQFYPVLPWVIG